MGFPMTSGWLIGAVEGKSTVTTHLRSTKMTDASPSGEADGLSVDPILNLAQQAMAKVVSESRRAAEAKQLQVQVTVQSPNRSVQVTDMIKALSHADPSRAEVLVADLLTSGVGVQDLCLEHLAPAARELGVYWEHDMMPFADVSMATARIQSIVRSIPSQRLAQRGLLERGALFAAVPDEAHTLGIVMAADHFRRRGWDVDLLIGMDHNALMRAIVQDDRHVVGLSCAGRQTARGLRELIHEIRRCRPDMAVVISGHVLGDAHTLQRLPYVDGVVHDLATAETVIESALQSAGVARERVSYS